MSFTQHEHVQVLQEAVVDVVESSVEVGEDVWELIAKDEEKVAADNQVEGEQAKPNYGIPKVSKLEEKAVTLIRSLLVCVPLTPSSHSH